MGKPEGGEELSTAPLHTYCGQSDRWCRVTQNGTGQPADPTLGSTSHKAYPPSGQFLCLEETREECLETLGAFQNPSLVLTEGKGEAEDSA